MAEITAAMASLLAVSASRAVVASRITLSDRSAMSGGSFSSPTPTTESRGWSAAAAVASGSAETNAAASSGTMLFISTLRLNRALRWRR